MLFVCFSIFVIGHIFKPFNQPLPASRNSGKAQAGTVSPSQGKSCISPFLGLEGVEFVRLGGTSVSREERQSAIFVAHLGSPEKSETDFSNQSCKFE